MLSAMGRISSGRHAGHARAPTSNGSPSVILQALSREMPRSFGARAAAESRVPWQSGANVLLQELFHPFHALLVLHLGQGVFHGVNGVIVGKIQFSRLIGIFRRDRKCASFPPGRDRRSPSPARVSSRNGTSVRTPISRQTSVISDHIRLFQGATAPSSMVRDSSGTSEARSTVRTLPVPPQVRAGALRVERQLLGGRRIKASAAFRADELLAPRRRLASVADNARWGSGGSPAGNTSAAGCSAAPFPFRRYCGCPARPGADAAPGRPGHVQHLVHLRPWPPASSGGGYRWRAHSR